MENVLSCMEDLLTAYAISISYVDFRLVGILITGRYFRADYKHIWKDMRYVWNNAIIYWRKNRTNVNLLHDCEKARWKYGQVKWM